MFLCCPNPDHQTTDQILDSSYSFCTRDSDGNIHFLPPPCGPGAACTADALFHSVKSTVEGTQSQLPYVVLLEMSVLFVQKAEQRRQCLSSEQQTKGFFWLILNAVHVQAAPECTVSNNLGITSTRHHENIWFTSKNRITAVCIQGFTET